MKRYIPILIAILAVAVSGCSKSNSTTTTSSVAQLSTFYFAANDSFPGLAKATFKIEERIDTGLVYNQDSIQFGTPLDSVVPKFTFAATPGSAILKTTDTTLVITGKDTVDFTKQPIYLTVTSSNGKTVKVYEIRATVHQIDPDLFKWEQLTEEIYSADNSEQQVLQVGDEFVFIKDNGFRVSYLTSKDGAAWSQEKTPTGLPDDCYVRGIITDGETLYYADSTGLYTSTDIANWTKQDCSGKAYKPVTMLLAWNNTVWVLANKNGQYELMNLQDGELTETGLVVDNDFPVSDFAAVAFESASLRERAMIMGGYTADGKAVNSRWNIEYSEILKDDTNNGYRIVNFAIDRPAFKSITGASVVWYDDKLYLFGGIDADMQYNGRDILVSEDEGISWVAADTTKNQLPDAYTARQKQSVIVRDNNIYVFGGESQTETFSDVYRGRLNSIDWE